MLDIAPPEVFPECCFICESYGVHSAWCSECGQLGRECFNPVRQKENKGQLRTHPHNHCEHFVRRPGG